MTHAFFKAGLFLAAGSVMHAMSGSGDITKMGGLRKLLPQTHATFLIYCLAIAGIVPFAGFFSKDEILIGAFGTEAAGWFPMYGKVLWIVLSLAALGTAFYMFRSTTWSSPARTGPIRRPRAHIHESPLSMTGPLIVLAIGTCVVGFLGLPHLSFVQKYVPNFLAEWLQPSLVDFGRPSLEGSIHRRTPRRRPADPDGHRARGRAWSASCWPRRSTGAGRRRRSALHRRGRRRDLPLARNKFYVDEIYDKIIVRPFRWIALGVFEVIDRFLIDWVLVEGSAFVVDLFGASHAGSRTARCSATWSAWCWAARSSCSSPPGRRRLRLAAGRHPHGPVRGRRRQGAGLERRRGLVRLRRRRARPTSRDLEEGRSAGGHHLVVQPPGRARGLDDAHRRRVQENGDRSREPWCSRRRLPRRAAAVEKAAASRRAGRGRRSRREVSK
jgi:NADH:ubiquinone oxidoreductase subunit 5 (subunit L)/multisubunit Na+/H+ antiporter MnhA subunit